MDVSNNRSQGQTNIHVQTVSLSSVLHDSIYSSPPSMSSCTADCCLPAQAVLRNAKSVRKSAMPDQRLQRSKSKKETGDLLCKALVQDALRELRLDTFSWILT